MTVLALLAPLLAVSRAGAVSSVDVRSYGAKGDGATDDASAIQRAVNACPRGGVVWIPEGRWLVQSKSVQLHSWVTLRGAGADSTVVKGRDLDIAVNASGAAHLVVEKLKFVVEPSTPAFKDGQLAHFWHCRDVTLQKCYLDGTAANGSPSQYSLCQFQCCNDAKCLDNSFHNAGGSATGATGASDDPTWGRRSEFARNSIDDYFDTGIGLWTGARDSDIHDNKIQGPTKRVGTFPVGIDVDGGTNSIIENNDIAGGQMGIRLYDTHDGVYPILAMMVRGNYLHDQQTYDAHHPAWAIKPENPKSRLEVTFQKNRIVESDPDGWGFMGGGNGQTVFHLDNNSFSGPNFWSFGAYKQENLQVFSNGAKVDWRSKVGSNTVRNPRSN